MVAYVAASEKFEKKMTIQESNAAASKSKYPKRHMHMRDSYEFTTVELQLCKDPAVCNLYKVRQLERSLVKKASPKPYVSHQKKARSGSVLISLMFPHFGLELILAVLDEDFLETHKVVLVTVDNKPLEEYNKEYVKVCVTQAKYVH